MTFLVTQTTEDPKAPNVDQGPRTIYQDSSNPPNVYMTIGAWGSLNNISSTFLPLVITAPKGLKITDLKTPPAGVRTRELRVDDSGNVFVEAL